MNEDKFVVTDPIYLLDQDQVKQLLAMRDALGCIGELVDAAEDTHVTLLKTGLVGLFEVLTDRLDNIGVDNDLLEDLGGFLAVRYGPNAVIATA